MNNIAISPNNNQKLFLALANGSKNQHGGILISNDGGFNWDYKLEGTTFNPMAFNPENPNEIYAGSWIKINPEHSQGLYKSTDGGETWNILPIAWTDYIMDHIGGIHIDPKNSNHILVLEENEIVHTTDGGLSWQSEVYQDAYDNADSYVVGVKASYNPFDQNEIMITSDYYPFKSSDNGATIEKIKSPYFNGYGNMKYFDNGTESHLYYGVQYGFVHRDLQTNVDTPYNVRPLNSQSANRGARVEIDANVAGRIMTLTPGLSGSQIKLSFDHGATQQMIASAFVDEFNAFASHPTKQNIMWASFSFSGDSPELYQIDAQNSDSPMVSSIQLPSYERVRAILFDPTNPNRVSIAQGAKLYRSENMGETWTIIGNGLEDLDAIEDSVLQLIQNELNPNKLYISSTKGIYISEDTGQNWTQISSVFAHYIQPSNQNEAHLIAITHKTDFTDFSVHISVDNGQNWKTIANADFLHMESSMPESASTVIFEPDFAQYYLSSNDLGLVKYTIDIRTLTVNKPTIITGKDLTIYPNPVQHELNIKTTKKINQIEIYSLTGQKILTSTKTNIEVSKLSKGIYILKVITDDGQQLTQKFIKK